MELPKKLPWAIIMVGVLCRLAQLIANRSLWLDEAALALKINKFSFIDLLVHPGGQPGVPPEFMVNVQAAPLGFIMLVKMSVKMFGDNEFALRLLPFLAGIIALLIFYKTAKMFVGQRASMLALGLFAVSKFLIYFSNELKPYSTDVLVSMLLYLMIIRLSESRISIAGMISACIIGAVAIWFSFPAVFILAGTGLSLAFIYFTRKSRQDFLPLIFIGFVWTLSLSVYCLTHLHFYASNEILINYWENHYMPLSSFSLDTIKWLLFKFIGIFFNPLGFNTKIAGYLGVLMFSLGCFSMISTDRKRFLILISPFIATLLSSGFQKYPFHGRLLLFLVPAMIIISSAGMELLLKKVRTGWRPVGMIAIILLFADPVYTAGYHIFRPVLSEEIKPVMTYIHEHQKKGDGLYVHYAAQYAFRYYAERHGFQNGDYIIGVGPTDKPENYIRDLYRLSGRKRIWLLFSNIYRLQYNVNIFLNYLDKHAAREDSFIATFSAAYLYDLQDNQ